MIKATGRPPRFPNQENPTTAATQDTCNNTSPLNYKNIFEKQYRCTCSLCTLVGTDLIKIQYSKGDSSVLIEDRSKRIFDLFVEKVVASPGGRY